MFGRDVVKAIKEIKREKERKSTTHYCIADYKHNHCWKLLGTVCFPITPPWEIFAIYQCIQCKKCIKEELKFIDEK